MGKHAATPAPEFLDRSNTKEVIVSSEPLEDGERAFLTGKRQPGTVFIETGDGAAYQIVVDHNRVMVQGLKGTLRDGFVPDGDAPVEITENTITGIHTEAEGRRSRDQFVGGFDIAVAEEVITIFPDETTLRVDAPEDFFINAPK